MAGLQNIKETFLQFQQAKNKTKNIYSKTKNYLFQDCAIANAPLNKMTCKKYSINPIWHGTSFERNSNLTTFSNFYKPNQAGLGVKKT